MIGDEFDCWGGFFDRVGSLDCSCLCDGCGQIPAEDELRMCAYLPGLGVAIVLHTVSRGVRVPAPDI